MHRHNTEQDNRRLPCTMNETNETNPCKVLLERKRSIPNHILEESDGVVDDDRHSSGGLDLVGKGSSSSHEFVPYEDTPEELRQLREIKASYEEQLGLYAERNVRYKQRILELQDMNHNLKQQLERSKRNAEGAVVKDLEEEISKWETLYEETAEVGAARMKRLEDELEQLRQASAANESVTVESKEHMEHVCKALVTTLEEMQLKETEFEDYKRKSTERVAMLNDLLEFANFEKEKEMDNLKRKQANEYALMEKVEDLEAEVQAKAAIIERERNQATKREARLREQIRKLQYNDPKPFIETKQPPHDVDFFDTACINFAAALDDTLTWCAPWTMETDRDGHSAALEVRAASE
jgi:hypothetical protein